MREQNRTHLLLLFACVAGIFHFASADSAAAPPPSDPRPKSFDFGFRWPVGTRAALHLTLTERPPDEAARVARFAATMVVAKHGERAVSEEIPSGDTDLLISFVEPKIEADRSTSPIWQTEALDFVRVPDFLVSSDGKFLGLLPQQHIQDDLRKASDSSGAPLFTPKAIDELSSWAERRARQLWDDWAAQWLGERIPPKAVFGTRRYILLPLRPFRVQSEFFIAATEPCRRGAQKRECVRVEMTDTTLPEDLAAWRQNLYSESNVITFSGTTTLLLEPDGIFPHTLSVKRTLDITGRRDGKSRSALTVWEIQTEWVYE